MEELVQKLKQLESNPDIHDEEDFLSNDIPIVKEISNLAESLFITKEGECNWDNIDSLGYRVFAVEKDRYGWLIGAIHTKKGIITYG